MSLFGTKDYVGIVAPLKKMVDDLKNYVDGQRKTIIKLQNDKIEIEKNIGISNTEISKSDFTINKITDLLAIDINELPSESNSESNEVQ